MPNKEIQTPYRIALLPNSRLSEILREFETPSDIQQTIARRAGALFPTNITHDQLKEIILKNMKNGQPNWIEILEELGEATNRVYKGKTPFPKPPET